MNFPAKPLSKIKEIAIGRFEREPSTIVLTVRNADDAEYQAAIASTDAGNLVASLITSVGRTLDETTTHRTELASTRVFIPGAGIGFGNTAAGPVLVAQTGGLALVFSITRRDLFDMAKQILEDLQSIEQIDSPPMHH